MSEKKPLIILTGPTAVGKTDLSLLLAKKVNITLKSKDKNGKIGIKTKGAITWQLKIREMIDK